MFNLNEAMENIKKGRAAAKAMEDKNEVPKISTKQYDMMEKTIRNMYGDYSKGRQNLKEALYTTDLTQLIPNVITGKLREAAEPSLLGTNFFKKITVDGGASSVYVIPVVGEIVAAEVSEGGKYKEDAVDFNTIEDSTLEVRVKKIGTRVAITEEAIADSSWDVLGINTSKMGKAMARYKEEWIFNEFSDKGHTVFDNRYRAQNAESGTTGLGKDGNPNDTLSVEDFLDLTLTLMSNGFNPTDVIMHPLTWVVFAKNSMLGNGMTFGALGGQNVSPWNTVQGTNGPFGLQNNGNGQKLIMSPEQVQNRLPVPLTVNFSPFVRFDKQLKNFDMYCLDRSEVGIIVQKDELTLDSWTSPERDIRNLKCKERYGIGILNQGRSICVAKNIAVAPSYPVPPTINIGTHEA